NGIGSTAETGLGGLQLLHRGNGPQAPVGGVPRLDEGIDALLVRHAMLPCSGGLSRTCAWEATGAGRAHGGDQPPTRPRYSTRRTTSAFGSPPNRPSRTSLTPATQGWSPMRSR